MSTYSFVSCLLLLMSSMIYELQQCLAQQFLFGLPEMTTIGANTTGSIDKAVTIPPPTSSRPTVSTNDTESNVTLGNSDLTCSQVVNITSNNTVLHFSIPRMNSPVHCIITIHGLRDQHLFLQLRNVSIQSGMLDCEQGSIQLYTLKQGLLYFRSRSCNTTQPPPQLTTENNVVILTVTSGNSKNEQHFELEVHTIDINNTESYGYPHAHYGHSGTSFGLPSIAYVPGASFGPPNFTYSRPGTTSRTPSATYGPPSATYAPPSATYGPLSATYRPPGATYGPPSATYGPPGATYGPPSATYGPPSATYGPPSATYGPPSATYGPPSATYGPPNATYRPQSTTYGPPSTTYSPPHSIYGTPGAPGYHLPTYNLGNNSNYIGNNIDRHYNHVSGYGYEYSAPPEYEHNYNAHPIQPSSPSSDGYGHHCGNDCDKQPWKASNSISYQSDTHYNPYSSPLYAWLTDKTKPKYWSNELH